MFYRVPGSDGKTKSSLDVNLVYSKFLFVTLKEHARARTRLQDAGSCIARGFFNDFHADGSPNPSSSNETVQFLKATSTRQCNDGLLSAEYVAHVTAKYRPRLVDIEAELVRRLGDAASVRAVDGSVTMPRYASAALQEYVDTGAASRQSGRAASNVIVFPMSKTPAWWSMNILERHAYFYPHTDRKTGGRTEGHAMAAEAVIQTIYRRLYHNPDGYQRAGEYDFITYFECSDEHMATFDLVRQALRDEHRNPEWRFVIEGPEWRGRRVLR
jgi:hypothetical protein